MSCQGGTRLNNTGLKIVNRSNVTVRGSGAIQGFDTGVLVEGGSNIDIEKLNVTGPDADLGVFLTGAATPRPDTQGILVRLTGLYSNIEIFANSVDNHTEGIRLESAKGVQVGLNFAHDNNGGLSSTFAAEAHGIHLVDSTDNTIHNNLIVDNGVNVPDDSGIMLDGSFNNRVHGNNVSFSNGDGIAVQQGSANNVIDNNVILYNTSNETIPTSNPPRIFFDLVSRNTVGPNTFNSNNRCETENAAVPAAVCNSGEGEPWTKKP
jgi:parallel beta-helix repeat protein